MTATNISEVPQSASGLTIYPNPAKDKIFIKSDLQINNIEIYDIAGRTVETSLQQPNSVKTINISSLPQGVYMVKVYTNEGVAVRKIVKE